jgi:hypothetical protein
VEQSVSSVSEACGGWISMEEARQWLPESQNWHVSTTHFTLPIGEESLVARDCITKPPFCLLKDMFSQPKQPYAPGNS